MDEKKIVFFAFNPEPACFVHVLLNALDYDDKGVHVKIVVEGPATKLVPVLDNGGHKFSKLFKKAREKELIAGVCKACSNVMGVLDDVKSTGLELLGEMSGHPGMAGFSEQGYEIITI